MFLNIYSRRHIRFPKETVDFSQRYMLLEVSHRGVNLCYYSKWFSYKWCVVTIIIAIFAWVLLGVPGVALPYGGS